MDNPRHDPTLFREARTLQRPSFQPSSYHSGRAMVCHLQAELSRRVRSDGGALRPTSPEIPLPESRADTMLSKMCQRLSADTQLEKRRCPSPKLDSSAFSTTSLVFLPTKNFEIKN